MKQPRASNVLILLFALLATALSKPNPTPPEEINTIGKGDVGVSWGGYSASAGLGRGAAGGGLHAEAFAPGVGAAAGLGGHVGGQAAGHADAGVPSAGAGAGGVAIGAAGAGAGATAGGPNYGPNHGHPPCTDKNCQGNGFFDGIFNIPISVLKAVNTYLNQKGQDGTKS